MSKSEILFSERNENLSKWHLRKEIFVKGVELFSKIDPVRAENDESLKEVGIACAAIDRLIGDETTTKEEKTKSGKKQKTMKSIWQKWTTENHTFTMVAVSNEEVIPFSGAVKEMLEKEDDHYIFLSLKYAFPGVPKPGEKAKPITNDQRLQNIIFSREMSKVWKAAKEELKLRVLESVSRAQQKAAQKNRSNSNDDDNLLNLDEVAVNAEKSTLMKLSIKQFKQWVEDDEDKKAEEEKEKIQEKQHEAKISHEQYVKKKDSLRIKLPPPDYDSQALLLGRPRPKSAGPKMTFGSTQGFRKKDDARPQTTVDLMLNSGLKYVHATNKGRRGMEGDLEKSRKQLMEKGFIVKENFDKDPESEFSPEEYQKKVQNNPTILEIKAQQQKIIEDSSKAYEEWAVLKANREQAINYLKYIPPPEPEMKDRMDGTGFRLTSNPLCILTRDSLDDCIEIGKLLKSVDRSLFTEWYQWANSHPLLSDSTNKNTNLATSTNTFNYTNKNKNNNIMNNNNNNSNNNKGISFNFATILWDYFEPRACDVHSTITSQVRETFMKILRPGLDFKAAFRSYVSKRLTKISANRDLDEEEKNKIISSIALGRKDMQQLLNDVGVLMKKNELNSLIDAFDQNGDGVVTLSEFLEFIGPSRDRNSGALTTLKKKCCWRTTCTKTGMNNAYAISEPTKEQLRKEGNNVLDEDRRSDAGGVRESIEKTLGEKREVIKLANGESRVRTELIERKKREDILKKYRILQFEETTKIKHDKKSNKNKSYSDEEYENEYEDDNDDNDDGGYGSDFDNPDENDKKNKKDTLVCSYSKWSISDRKKALKTLADLTRDAREEASLKAMLADGSPPSAPKLWAAGLTDIEVDETNEEELTNSILVRWAPGQPSSDLISFFSLEFAGKVGLNSRGDRKYTEIFRDPEVAVLDAEFSSKYKIENLEPGCSYAFRIRGINGFGPGPFTYGIFSTRSSIPPPPRIISVTHDSVVLRWVFSNNFFYQLQQLKKLFELADTDGSGVVSREELILMFNEKHSQSSETLKLIRKVLIKKGVNPDTGIIGIFDLIETDDDNQISWDEFEKFFVAAGITNDSMALSKSMNLRNSGTGKLNQSFQSTTNSISRNNNNGSGSGNGNDVINSNVSYIIEQCESELTDTYRECMKCLNGQCTISRLSPGQTYKFRVYGVNVDGIPGPKSEPVIVHTMIETPSAPTLNTKLISMDGMDKIFYSTSVYPTKVILKWKSRREGLSSRDKGLIDRMLGDWAGINHEDNGVSIEAMFSKYDSDGNQSIDPKEFGALLQDLGIEPSEERLSAAFSSFDSNNDGKISFDEFSKWWKKDDVLYTLKRSELIEPTIPGIIGALSSTEQSVNRSSTPINVSQSQSQQQRSKTPIGTSREQKSKINSESRSKLNSSGLNIEQQQKQQQQQQQFSIVPVSVPCGHGSETKNIEISALTPNSLYHFRLRYVGSRSNSGLSPPLVLMTTPIACEAPTLIFLTPTSVRIKWYPPEFGAYKYCVQIKNLTSRSMSNNNNNSNNDDYTTVFLGQETYWISTTLSPDTLYAVRVIGVNAQGHIGIPSSPLTFRTLTRDNTEYLNFLKNIHNSFDIECTGDICVGDTILLTERLYRRPTIGTATTSSSSSSNSNNNNVTKNKNDNKGNNNQTMNPNLSIYTILSGGNDKYLITNNEPERFSNEMYIGERMIIAHVIKDNYKTIRSLNAQSLSSQSTQNWVGNKYYSKRNLWLEILWNKCSNDSSKSYELKTGEIVKRLQSHIEQFEVFRCKWIHEQNRKSLKEDYNLLDSCFLQYQC